MTIGPKDAQYVLNVLGWKLKEDGDFGPASQKVLSDFQRGWRLGPPLAVDGKLGPKTREALEASHKRAVAKQPDASANFFFREFACKCGGRYSGCARIRVHRFLLDGLEAYRTSLGRDVTVVSGYRCPQHNAAVGGASSSQHVYGAAADVEAIQNRLSTARLRVFAGIGYQRASKNTRHVDVRHVSGNNTTGGTPDRPTLWVY